MGQVYGGIQVHSLINLLSCTCKSVSLLFIPEATKGCVFLGSTGILLHFDSCAPFSLIPLHLELTWPERMIVTICLCTLLQSHSARKGEVAAHLYKQSNKFLVLFMDLHMPSSLALIWCRPPCLGSLARS